MRMRLLILLLSLGISLNAQMHPFPGPGRAPVGGAPATGCAAVAQGSLELCLQVDEASGATLNDLSPSNLDGTFGASTAAPTWATSGGEAVLSFDGGDHVGFGNVLDKSNVSAFSVVVAIFIDGANHTGTFYSKANQSAPGEGYVFDIVSGDLRAIFLNNFGTTNFMSRLHTTNLGVGSWMTVAFTKSTASNIAGVKLYLNGAELTTSFTTVDSLSATIANSLNLSMGSRNNAGFRFTGDIAFVAQAGEEWDSTEVLQTHCAIAELKPGLSLPTGSCP